MFVLLLAMAALWSGAVQAQTRIERFFGEWKVTCVEPAQGGEAEGGEAAGGAPARRCSMSQTLLARETRRPVVRWVILPAADGGAPLLAVSAPLGVLLQPGLRLAFGGEEALVVPYTVCGPRWCQATLRLSEELRRNLAGHDGVEVSFVRPGGRRLALEAPLDGFGPALEHLLAQSSGTAQSSGAAGRDAPPPAKPRKTAE